MRRGSSLSNVSTENDRELVSDASTSGQDLINADLVSTFSVTSEQIRLKTLLYDQKPVSSEDAAQDLINADLVSTSVNQPFSNKDEIWQNKINTINSNWKYSFDTLALTFRSTFSEQIRKSSIYQTTEKAYKELKIKHEVLVKNNEVLGINHKNTKKKLEATKKENADLDKELTLKKQELETAKKENANLDKKLTLKEQELETAKKENMNLNEKLTVKKQELKTAKKDNTILNNKLSIKEQVLETAKKKFKT
ncbi:hypothetical protein C2G38_2212565 [Gigaspora rosea]|uniref:Uncharacterized protein n=1 Tax=Gigaspora rosea TaxID=44941 RepID=A0A397UH05_9GLOM|nr:hypothetical protein C2G38_2212565 [Gigaspora rosea]